jgi:hypothetical protein
MVLVIICLNFQAYLASTDYRPCVTTIVDFTALETSDVTRRRHKLLYIVQHKGEHVIIFILGEDAYSM